MKRRRMEHENRGTEKMERGKGMRGRRKSKDGERKVEETRYCKRKETK